jgi:UDP-N-acetylmuramoylalanine--D-glutamate ligase
VATKRTRDEFVGRRIAIVGIDDVTMAAASALRHIGARVILSDERGATALGSRLGALDALEVELRIEARPEDSVAGAEMVIPSAGIARNAPVLELAAKRGLPIYSEAEVAYRIAEAPMIAVAGTVGKTSTARILSEMLRAAGKRTWNAGEKTRKSSLMAAAVYAHPEDVIVAEICTAQLEWVEFFGPKVGVLTNITHVGAETYGGFVDYCGLFQRFFAAQQSDDFAVINAVSAPAWRIGTGVKSHRYSFDRGHCGTCDCACVHEGEMLLRWDGVEHHLGRVDKLELTAIHDVENILAAAGAAVAFGIPPQAIIKTVLTLSRSTGRLVYGAV